MTLPFDGAITKFLAEEAPSDVRKALEKAGKRDILSKSYPYKHGLKRKAYDQAMEGLQRQLVRMQAD
ncbi:MAG: polyphosphate kinase 2, partial [Pseudorhodobacter sp.]